MARMSLAMLHALIELELAWLSFLCFIFSLFHIAHISCIFIFALCAFASSLVYLHTTNETKEYLAAVIDPASPN